MEWSYFSIFSSAGDHSIHDRERSAAKRKRSSQGVGDHSIHDTERTGNIFGPR